MTKIISVKKGYWMLWQYGYGGWINCYRIFGRIVFIKWHLRRARRAAGVCVKCGTAPGEFPCYGACEKHMGEYEAARVRKVHTKRLGYE